MPCRRWLRALYLMPNVVLEADVQSEPDSRPLRTSSSLRPSSASNIVAPSAIRAVRSDCGAKRLSRPAATYVHDDHDEVLQPVLDFPNVLRRRLTGLDKPGMGFKSFPCCRRSCTSRSSARYWPAHDAGRALVRGMGKLRRSEPRPRRGRPRSAECRAPAYDQSPGATPSRRARLCRYGRSSRQPSDLRCGRDP